MVYFKMIKNRRMLKMRATERLEEIINILHKHGKIYVKELSHYFNVSEDLIRKDLRKLEERHLLERVHGGAELKHKKFDASNVKYRMQVNRPQKRIIAKKIITLLDNEDTLFLDTSTTCAIIAEEIAKIDIELTIFTNMLEIIKILEDNPRMTVIGVGGEYDASIGGFTGHYALSFIQQLTVDKAIVSCMSANISNNCLISSTLDIGHTKKAILQTGRIKILATETRKFCDTGVFRFYPISDLNYIATDATLEVEKEIPCSNMPYNYSKSCIGRFY